MQICEAMKCLRVAAVPAISIVIGVTTFVSAPAQTTSSTTLAAPPVKLQTYTLPDKSASAGVPAGWKVKGGGAGMIVMTGSQGENITLGQIILAHDGPFQVGQKGPDGAAITMPSSAKLSDKLIMIYQQTAAAGGQPAPQIKFLYGKLLQVPAAMGQCGTFIVSNSAIQADAMGTFCSLPVDSGQFFKNIIMNGFAPAAVAAQAAPIVSAVFKSYKIAPPRQRPAHRAAAIHTQASFGHSPHTIPATIAQSLAWLAPRVGVRRASAAIWTRTYRAVPVLPGTAALTPGILEQRLEPTPSP
jgi:hypothetical protein